MRQATCTGTQLGCDASVAPWPMLTLTFTAVAGTKYYIVTDASYSGPIVLTSTVTVTAP